jgi:L-Ala-D/L-Glu epimerase
VNLEFQALKLHLANVWANSRTASTRSVDTLLIRLIDQHALVGLGECAPIARYGESVDKAVSLLAKIDPKTISGNVTDMDFASSQASPIDSMAISCAMSVALHDLASKRAGKPLHDFLGLEFQEHRHLTSYTIGIDKPAVIRQKVIDADAYPVLKLKVGVRDDLANLRALREAAPRKTVRLDANEGWTTKEQALQSIELLAGEGHIEFVEQPMPADRPPKDWIWLKARSPLPVFADESYHSAADADRAAECFHGVNVKLAKTGGIPAAVQALQAARQRGLKTMLGCMIETSVLISTAAHLASLCDYLDLDGNLLITNDPFVGVSATKGFLSFTGAAETFGLRVSPR